MLSNGMRANYDPDCGSDASCNQGAGERGSAGSAQKRTHQAVPNPKRAVQFMPFAALKGYYDLVSMREEGIAREVIESEWLSLSPEEEAPEWDGEYDGIDYGQFD